MQKIRSILLLPWVAMVLLLLAGGMIYAGGSQLFTMRSAQEYEDRGVMTFKPYKVLPHSVPNTGSSRSRRTNPTKTVYMVYYRTSDGVYQWHREAITEGAGKEIVAQGEPVDRRVLFIVNEGVYITVAADQTAESYVAGQRKRSYEMLGGAVVILMILGATKLSDMLEKKTG